MTTPVRLQLSRRKGFSLQKLSMETNGLPAVNVARPSKWGNPFRVVCLYDYRPRRDAAAWGVLQAFRLGGTDVVVPGFSDTHDNIADARARAVRLYRQAIDDDRVVVDAAKLVGRNLACWCDPSHACHADVLLELAARP